MLNAQRIQVTVLHSEPVSRAGLSFACANEPDFEVREMTDVHPDIIIADYQCGIVSAMSGGSRVLIVGGSDREWDIRKALECGVRGYLLAGCELEEIVTAIRAVHRGGRYLSPLAASRLAESVNREPLTAREEEVLRLVARGLPNKSIANRLGIAAGTVKSHLKSTFGKLNVRNRTQAVTLVEHHGLIARAD